MGRGEDGDGDEEEAPCGLRRGRNGGVFCVRPPPTTGLLEHAARTRRHGRGSLAPTRRGPRPLGGADSALAHWKRPAGANRSGPVDLPKCTQSTQRRPNTALRPRGRPAPSSNAAACAARLSPLASRFSISRRLVSRRGRTARSGRSPARWLRRPARRARACMWCGARQALPRHTTCGARRGPRRGAAAATRS
jgi:hypothetical protein